MFTIWQIILITLAVMVIMYEQLNIQQIFKFGGTIVILGFVTGLIMGDTTTGLLVGGTMELMALGLAGYGGASVPNYRVGAVVGTAFAIATNGGLEVALVVGIPTATLGVQLDVLAKMLGSFWLHLAQKQAELGNYKASYRIILFGNIFGSRTALGNVYPTFLYLVLGATFIDKLIAVIPAWFTSSLTAVGNVLPALGMAILLKYLPIKGNFHYLALGFVLFVFFGVDILPIAIIGAIIAVLVYKAKEKESKIAMAAGGVGDE